MPVQADLPVAHFRKDIPVVPIFCCYFVDRKDRVRRTIEIEALSLGEAINQAQKELKTSQERLSFELWEGARRVHPEHRDDSIEEAARRLETLLGNLAGTLKESHARTSSLVALVTRR